MSADQQRQMQELQHQMARLQTDIEETKQREKKIQKQNPTPDFINEPLENNEPIDPDNFKEMHAFMFDEPEVYGKWRERQQQLNTDNFNVWRRKFNAYIRKNMTDHRKFFAESPYRDQDLVAAWGWHNQPLKKLPSIETNTISSKMVSKQAPSKQAPSKQAPSKQAPSKQAPGFWQVRAPSKQTIPTIVFPQAVFPSDITNNDEQPGTSHPQYVQLYNMFQIQQKKIEELEKRIDYDKI